MEQNENNNTLYVDVDGSNSYNNITFSTMYNEPEVIRTIINHDRVEVIKKATSMINYTSSSYSNGPEPKVWKEIYEPVDGKIIHTKTIEGRYVPPQSERFEFDN